MRAALAIVAVWMLAFAPQVFLGRTFVLGDAREFRTFSDFSRARWSESHTRTFWNPYVFAGIPAVPSLADSRPQYLPDALIDLYEKVRMPRAWPLAGPLLAHLAGMLAMMALARRLWGVGAAGMAAAALVWGLSPMLLGPFTFGHDARLVSASLMPVVLLAVHELMAQRPGPAVSGALGLALVLGVQVLTGHPQIVIYSTMLAIAFAIEEALRRRKVQRLWLALGAAVLAAALSAAVWLPALSYSAHAFRGVLGGLGEVGQYSNAWRDLLAICWPGAVGAGDTYWGGIKWIDYTQYLGLAALLIAALSWRRMPSAVTGPARLLGVTLAMALLVSLGATLGPVYAFLHRYVPLWSTFRVPAAALLMAPLALALLAARGFTVAAVERPPGRTRISVAAVLGAAVLLGVLLATGALDGPYTSLVREARATLPAERALAAARHAGVGLVQAVVLAALAVAAFVMRGRSGRTGALASAALLGVMVLDLGLVSRPLLTRAGGTPADLRAPAPRPLVRLTAADHAARAYPARNLERDPGRPLDPSRLLEFASNFWIPWRARSLGGNHGAVPAVWHPIVQRELTRWYPVAAALGAVYIATDPGAPMDSTLYAPVPGSGEPPVYRLRDALGRAYAVELVAAPGTDEQVVEAMATRDFVPRVIAFASDADRAVVGSYPGSARAALRWIRDDPDRLELEARTSGPAFVVIADTFFPGWTATLDGAPLEIHRVNQALRGVVVSDGVHRIAMTYEPEGWRAAVAVTRAAMAVWIVLAVGLGILRARARAGRFARKSSDRAALDPTQSAP